MNLSTNTKSPNVGLRPKMAPPATKGQPQQQDSSPMPVDTYQPSEPQDSLFAKLKSHIPKALGAAAAFAGYSLGAAGGTAGLAAAAPAAAIAGLTGLAGLSAAAQGSPVGGIVVAAAGVGLGAGILALGAGGGLVAGIAGAAGLGFGTAFIGDMIREKLS